MKRTMTALLLALAVSCSFSQSKEFNLFGTGVFHPGMTEAQARSVLDKLHRKYQTSKDARTKSSIWISRWIEDKQQVLDGPVDLGLRFEGKDLFKNDRVLVCIWVVWKNWSKEEDVRAGVQLANEKLAALLGPPTGKQIDTGWSFWKLKGGDLQVYPLSCVTAEFNMRGEIPD